MNASWMKGLVAGTVIATAGGAIAGYNLMDRGPAAPAYAEVLNVQPITAEFVVPEEVCENVTVTQRKAPRDEHRIAGTVTGAVVGGVIGSQIGGGSGKKIATVAGAAAGGYAGNRVQERVQANDTHTTTERRCRTANNTEQRVIGFDVTYRLGSEEGQVRMDRDPGDRIDLVDGQLAL
jgi:uncharacterized protein YcfJ